MTERTVGMPAALIETQSLSAGQRLGSSRMGADFLRAYRKLDALMPENYTTLISRGEAYNHIPAGWRQSGFDKSPAQPVAVYGICTGFSSAAVRLSIIGHVDAQATHSSLRPLIGHILSVPVCDLEETYPFIPQGEIASMNHETDDMRLFVN